MLSEECEMFPVDGVADGEGRLDVFAWEIDGKQSTISSARSIATECFGTDRGEETLLASCLASQYNNMFHISEDKCLLLTYLHTASLRHTFKGILQTIFRRLAYLLPTLLIAIVEDFISNL